MMLYAFGNDRLGSIETSRRLPLNAALRPEVTLRSVIRVPTAYQRRKSSPTNQRHQDFYKPLILLIGKLPMKSTNRGDLVGW